MVLSATGDSAAQYMNYMNVFFTSQKLNIPVDVCMVGQVGGAGGSEERVLPVLHGTRVY